MPLVRDTHQNLRRYWRAGCRAARRRNARAPSSRARPSRGRPPSLTGSAASRPSCAYAPGPWPRRPRSSRGERARTRRVAPVIDHAGDRDGPRTWRSGDARGSSPPRDPCPEERSAPPQGRLPPPRSGATRSDAHRSACGPCQPSQPRARKCDKPSRTERCGLSQRTAATHGHRLSSDPRHPRPPATDRRSLGPLTGPRSGVAEQLRRHIPNPSAGVTTGGPRYLLDLAADTVEVMARAAPPSSDIR